MKTNLTPDRKRINHDEYDAFIALECACSLLESKKTRPVLAERLKGVQYGSRDMGAASAALRRALKNLYNTVPYEQLKHLSNNVHAAAVRVGVFVNGAKKNDHGMILTFEQIAELMKAASEKCLICDKDPQEQRKCPLAKVLNELPGEKNENSNGCGWYGL